ncbi:MULTISPECIES: hypothetical protein [Acinetobacter]|uniref:hypothetical protein n=1 Tax=Acinetobacter TaxID=469 RepID=UPI0002D059C7|nr:MULTISPECIES: hypothetical protein [Acinetobacter]ENW53083.1 hypothetical protein F918_02257 [Acinetobacter baumannii NIPH 601]MCT6913255.1 hypothetical protein [Acinetobacter baumannii]MCT6938487.1 hypothetical protein [Acinetobacter baumannii]MCW8527511.1 hypothetical protein [Acinetobacter baumannii]MCW8531369.1 hypothetical protein [Acinetobacter baumannii]
MKKSFFLAYTTNLNSIDLVRIFEKKFDISFIEHSSDYLGNYYSYEGLLCDNFKILQNKLPDGDLQINNGGIETILKLGFLNGKNKEKQSKYEFMKKQLASLDNINLHSFDILEEE